MTLVVTLEIECGDVFVSVPHVRTKALHMDEDTNVAVWPEGIEEYGLERYISQKARDAMPESDFAGSGTSFPITDQTHLDAAVKLLGRESPDEQTKIKSRIREIAKRKGLSLPESWQNEDKSDDTKERVAAVEPVVEATLERSVATEEAASLSIYLPITRSDATQRMVYGQATVEQPDAYGTIFGYCPEAWQKWRGNIREQHDPKKAVGRALEVTPDELERAIYVGSKVSRGAQDTWLKVEDGVLSGYSASIIPDAEYGPNPAKWPRKTYEGKEYPYLPRYSVVELSLVDNPATPGCNISIVRADGFTTDVLDNTPEPEVVEGTIVQPETDNTTTASSVAVGVSSLSPQALERAGARMSASTRSGLHDARNAALKGAMGIMTACDCAECQAACRALDPDSDGDIDFMALDDTDSDAAVQGVSDEEMAERMMRYLAPAYQRMQLIAGQLSRSNASYTSTFDAIQAKLDTLETTFTTALERVATNSNFERVLSELSAVKVDVERIAAQPAPGGPILNGARPAEKHLATDPRSGYSTQQDMTMDMLLKMQKAGLLDTPEKQVAAAALAVQPTRGYMG
jgi:hypothetical protein